MSDLRRRVSKLERELGAVSGSGWCECERKPSVRVVWPDGEPVPPFASGERQVESEPLPEVCERCGLPVRVEVITVVFEDDDDWRGERWMT